MAIFTLTEITEAKAAWKAALLAVANGKSYSIGDRQLTRANVAEIKEMLAWLESEERALGTTDGPAFVSGRVNRDV